MSFDDYLEYYNEGATTYIRDICKKNNITPTEPLSDNALFKWGLYELRVNRETYKDGKTITCLRDLMREQQNATNDCCLYPASGTELATRFRRYPWLLAAWQKIILTYHPNVDKPSENHMICIMWKQRIGAFETNFKDVYQRAVARDNEYKRKMKQ